jgi:hypothetical protein
VDLATSEGGAEGRKDAVDLMLPPEDILADPGNEGVRCILASGRGPSGARGTVVRLYGVIGGRLENSERSVSRSNSVVAGWAVAGADMIGMGFEMTGLGALTIIVDARLGRGARGPPGSDGETAGSEELVVGGVA